MAQSFIAGIFGHSPVRPLQQHMAKVMECIRELPPFIEAAQAGDWNRAEAQHNRIADCEHEADALKKQIRLQLPSTLFMPVARADLLELLTMQDKIANKTKDISGLMLGRRMATPGGLGGDLSRSSHAASTRQPRPTRRSKSSTSCSRPASAALRSRS